MKPEGAPQLMDRGFAVPSTAALSLVYSPTYLPSFLVCFRHAKLFPSLESEENVIFT
jgi:hypothetical protein